MVMWENPLQTGSFLFTCLYAAYFIHHSSLSLLSILSLVAMAIILFNMISVRIQKTLIVLQERVERHPYSTVLLGMDSLCVPDDIAGAIACGVEVCQPRYQQIVSILLIEDSLTSLIVRTHFLNKRVLINRLGRCLVFAHNPMSSICELVSVMLLK